MATDTVMAPVHPGEILLEEFLKPLAVSQYKLAKEIGVPARRINEIVHGQRRISADTALRLARFFGTSERFWINLQSRYDMEIERTGSATRSTASARSRPPADCPGGDQTEWQIEWQTAPVRACPGLASAGLCSCSAWSAVLPAIRELCGGLW